MFKISFENTLKNTAIVLSSNPTNMEHKERFIMINIVNFEKTFVFPCVYIERNDLVLQEIKIPKWTLNYFKGKNFDNLKNLYAQILNRKAILEKSLEITLKFEEISYKNKEINEKYKEFSVFMLEKMVISK